MLALDHIGKGLQRTLVRPGNSAATTTVVEQRIHRLLQHTLLVANDDIGRIEIKQSLETVVTVNYPTIKIVEIGSRKPTTVQRNQRSQIGRQHRQHRHDHPVWFIARVNKSFHELKSLRQFLDLGFRIRCGNLFSQYVDLFV